MGIKGEKLSCFSLANENLDAFERLQQVLSQDFDFHTQKSSYASHNFHSFPAKFPPQLPRQLIEALTDPGDVVLDPMMGSGTAVVEAFLSGRYALGFDIDPLSVLLTRTKTTSLDGRHVLGVLKGILERAKRALAESPSNPGYDLKNRWNLKTRNFLSHWFHPETQPALLALIKEIDNISNKALHSFFRLVFSAIIITKTGGCSLALDLGHTRPHKAKIIIDQRGRIIQGEEFLQFPERKRKLITKRLRSPLAEFEKKAVQNLRGLPQKSSERVQPYLPGFSVQEPERISPQISMANAQSLPLDEASVDLIVTSPPYASNAIDYMRAHKFSLIWFGYGIDDLTEKRREYVGGETTGCFSFEMMPDHTAAIINEISREDKKKGQVLHRYYSEMRRVLLEMYRVLKPGKCAIIVVGSSVMRGKDTDTQRCLAEIGRTMGFHVPKIGVRNLDRNRRMMPAGTQLDLNSQIQKRMHEEYIIGFYKP